MRIGDFGLYIPEGTERDSGHVSLADGSVYTLQLYKLGNSLACDAQVSIDGKDMGTYRVERNKRVVLERAPNDPGRFTFFSSKTRTGIEIGQGIAPDDRGLIQVTFRPGKYREKVIKLCGGLARGGEQPSGGMGFAAAEGPGITGLTGHSNQWFTNVEPLIYDGLHEVVISLRLVASLDAPRQMVSAVRQANPVPAPVD